MSPIIGLHSSTPFWLILSLVNTHTHWREDTEDELVMHALIEYSLMGGATVLLPMPNTKKGLLTAKQVWAYHEHGRMIAPRGASYRTIPTAQITEQTTIEDIDAWADAGIMDVKAYPLNRTTNSELGIRHYSRMIHLFRHCGKRGIRVHFHPEHPLMLFGNRDAEFAFLAIMDMLMTATEEAGTVFVWEHGTDARCIPFWEEWARTGRFYVTLTAHHLATHEDRTYGDVQATCKPPYKTAQDQRGLIDLVAMDSSWVMAGGDDAPHPKGKKHVLGPCACGAYTAPFLLPLYAHALSHLLETGREDIFARFINGNARELYGIPEESTPLIKLVKRPMTIPETYRAGPWEIEPFWAGRTIDYSAEWSVTKTDLKRRG